MSGEKYAAALRELTTNKGELTPQRVVKAAADPESPLHKAFDWDDTKAGRKWRIHQARQLIKSIRVVIETSEQTFKVPEYIRNPDKPAKKSGYIRTVTIATEETRAREALIAEFARAGSILTRARQFAKFFGMVADIDRLIDDVTTLRSKAEEHVSQ